MTSASYFVVAAQSLPGDHHT